MSGTAKQIVTGLAEKFGYSIIPNWRLESRALAQHLRKVFEHCAITTVFDVGANTGQYHDFLRQQVGFVGQVHSFEPQQHLAATLQQRQANDPAWTIHNLGLGSSNGELTLNVMARDTFSSFRQPAAGASDSFSASNTVINSVVVPVRRLDDLFPESALNGQSCYLKVDTQGFDLDVLLGAPGLLKNTRALQFELAIQRLYAGVSHYREMLEIVENMGFCISGLFPISMDDQLRAVEFDCVMVRTAQTN